MPPVQGPVSSPGSRVAGLSRVSVRYDGVLALDAVDLDVNRGEVVAVMGRNGSGKSTLLTQLAGVRAPSSGAVTVDGADPATLSPRELVARVGLVPQDAGALLYGETVAGECAGADHDTGLPEGTTATVLARILPGMPGDRHPRDLSEGQRLALALAIVLAPAPPLVLLDEPTRGLDYPGKARLVRLLADLAVDGHAVVVATHDVELVAQVATRAVVLAEGEVVADGPARDVVCHSPVFVPRWPRCSPRIHGSPSTKSGQASIGGAIVAERARVTVVRLRPRAAVLLAVTSLVGVAAFGWPLFLHTSVSANQAHSGDAVALRGDPAAPAGRRGERAVRGVARRQGDRPVGDPGGVRCGPPGTEPRGCRVRARLLPARSPPDVCSDGGSGSSSVR